MAERRYYWLKLKEDFFRQKVMKKLRRMEHGETYTIIYLKMQLDSLRNDGIIVFDGLEDSFAEELALQIDEREEDVTATVDFLTQHGLIIQLSETESYLPQAVENTGSEGSSAKRVRELRKREALQCNDEALQRYGELELEKRDREKSKRVEYRPPSAKAHDDPISVCSDSPFQKPTIEEITAYCADQGLYMDASSFYDYNEARGWMIGQAQMKDWRAAARRWASKEKSGKPKATTDYESGDDFRNG